MCPCDVQARLVHVDEIDQVWVCLSLLVYIQAGCGQISTFEYHREMISLQYSGFIYSVAEMILAFSRAMKPGLWCPSWVLYPDGAQPNPYFW